jgi:hypothetical protein
VACNLFRQPLTAKPVFFVKEAYYVAGNLGKIWHIQVMPAVAAVSSPLEASRMLATEKSSTGRVDRAHVSRLERRAVFTSRP